MDNDQKHGIRIIAERVSVTTIRTPAIIYCKRCRRSLDVDEIDLAALASESRNIVEAAETASTTGNKEGETK